MEMFLWTVEDHFMFWVNSGIRLCFYHSDSTFENTHISMSTVDLRRSIMPKLGRFFFVEIPILERLLFFGDSHFANSSAFTLISVDLS